MVVAAVAVIGKQNNPLYIRTFQRAANAAQPDADAATQLHYVVHAALDVIEERGACARLPRSTHPAPPPPVPNPLLTTRPGCSGTEAWAAAPRALPRASLPDRGARSVRPSHRRAGVRPPA